MFFFCHRAARTMVVFLGFVALAGVFFVQDGLASSPSYGKNNPKPRKDWRQVLVDAKQLPPTIYENEVRDWFKSLKFSGFKQESIFNEFHPDDGNLVATYKNGAKMLYVSYVDHNRMSPFGFKRTAKDMVAAGNKRDAQTFEVKGFKWHGDAGAKPLIAVDVAPTVKVVLLGYSGLSLGDLQKFATDVPLDSLAKLVKK